MILAYFGFPVCVIYAEFWEDGKTRASSVVTAQQFPIDGHLYSVVKRLQIKYYLLVMLDVR